MLNSTAEPRPAFLIVLTWSISATGGVNETAFGVAQALPELGWRPIIGVATWSKTEQVSEARGIPVVNLCLRDLASVSANPRALLGFAPAAVRDGWNLRRLVRSHKIRVIGFQFPSLAALLPVIMRTLHLLPAEVILCFQGNDYVDMSNSRGLTRRLWQFALRRADAVTACSKALADKVQSFLPGLNVQTAHNGVNHKEFLIPRVGGRPRPRLLQVAKFEHKKAHDVTLPAFRRVLDSGIDAELSLIGASGPALDNTRHLIHDLRLENHVSLQVDLPHDEIPGRMANADIFLLPSRIEPFGIVLVEAGVVGLPVVAARAGGIPELLTDGDTGLLIAPDDEQALANALMRLLTDKEFAERLASAWHNRVMSRWSWTETARAYLRAVNLSA